jgi:hypothetical protein
MTFHPLTFQLRSRSDVCYSAPEGLSVNLLATDASYNQRPRFRMRWCNVRGHRSGALF